MAYYTTLSFRVSDHGDPTIAPQKAEFFYKDAQMMYRFKRYIKEVRCARDGTLLPRWEQIKILKVEYNDFYNDWMRRYTWREIRRIQSAGRREALDRAYKQRLHQERQAAWYGGGREAHYRAHHPFGREHHAWLMRGIRRATGMEVTDRVISTCSYESAYERDWPMPAPRPQPRRPRSDHRSDRAQAFIGPMPQAREAPKRSIMLLYKLRAYIRALRTAPMRVWNAVPTAEIKGKSNVWAVAQPQMEGLAGESPSTIQSQNVVLSEDNAASHSVAASNRFSFDWHQLCSTEPSKTYDDLTDRFTFFKSFEWTSEQGVNTEIKDCEMELPLDFVESVTADGSMPMFIPFKIFRYVKSDIEIKFHVNSNKFQVGQLQFSWQYLERYDGNPLTNIYSRSQLPHVVVNAGASNEATLTVPFKYVQPYLPTVDRVNGLKKLALGTLRCFVISPLAVGEGGPKNCSVSVFIRFPRAAFTGMRDGSLVEPQMEAAAAMMIASKAVGMLGDRNCDNPSTNVNPSYLVPTASHSWSAGTGLTEQVHGLRLDNSTIGVGRVGIDLTETSIGIPCRTFGMLKHFEWSVVDKTKNTTGYLLWECDANAQIPKDKVYTVVTENALDEYAYPPVSVVTSLFRQWRGSLEFRFDIVASQFHTGRLICAYIPGAYGSAAVTLKQARNSPHVEFSLNSSTSFTFIVPYISDRVFWPRRYTGPHKYSENASPSKLVLFVLNPLIPMQSIVNHVRIIPYVRAGEDFEVSIPVQPSIGLSDNGKSSLAIKDRIYPTTGSFPYRATNYEGFGGDKKYIFYEGTTAFGTASTFHAPETKLLDYQYYYGKAQKSLAQPTVKWISKTEKDKDGKPKQFEAYASHIVLWSVPGKGNFGIPFPSGKEGEEQANLVARMLHIGDPVANILAQCYDYVEDSNDSNGDVAKLHFLPVLKSTRDEWTVVDAQMEDQRAFSETQLMPTASLPSTSAGQFNYNERFDDLKTLARRYQLYAEKKLNIPKEYQSSDALMVFPCRPHGLALDIENSSSIFNIIRDGHIPVISSSYIYFRGSLRYKIVLSSDNVVLAGTKVWLQHHPDGDAGIDQVQLFPNIVIEDRVKSHSYGFYIQAMNVNSIIEFEVPFYQSGMYGLTRKPKICDSRNDICNYYTLGNIVLGMYCGKLEKSVDVSIQIFYSVSDDFSFSTFRGFPHVVFTDEVWAPQSELERAVEEEKKKEIVWITGDPQMEEAQPEMMSSLKNYVFGKVKTEAVGEVKTMVSETMAQVKSDFAELYRNSDHLSCHVPTVASALGNLAHVLANPTPKTVAISVVNVIISFFSHKIGSMVAFIEAAYKLVSKYWHMFSGQDRIETQMGDADEDVGSQFAALMFTSVCMLGGKTIAAPGKFPDMLRGINSGVSLYNNMIRLVQNSAGIIKFSIKYIVGKLHPDRQLQLSLLDNAPDVLKWFNECEFLLDVRNKNKYLYDRCMMSRVFDACVLGSLLVSAGISKTQQAGKLIWDTHRSMRKLQTELFERGAHPDVRFECFPLWLSGAPGIGKSYMVTKLVNDLLKSIEFSQPGSLIYYIPSGAKYWSGCQNPAVLVSDDLFQVDGQKMEDEIANLFTICSSSVLNPPMAAVEDKERRLNPLLYVMLCNSHFPELQPKARHMDAIYRRRRYVIDADLKEEYKSDSFRDASQLPRDITSRMGHLRFRFANNVKDPKAGFGDWMTYDEMYAIISENFRAHYFNERENFKVRMRNMYCLDPNYDENNLIEELPELDPLMPLADQIDIVKRRIQDQLDAYEDPGREPEVWDYIRKFKDRTIQKLADTVSYQSDEAAMIPEPGPAFAADEKVSSFFELNHPDDCASWEYYCAENKLMSEFSIDELHSMIALFSENDSLLRMRVMSIFNHLVGYNDSGKCMRDLLDEFLLEGNFSAMDMLRFLATLPDYQMDVCMAVFENEYDKPLGSSRIGALGRGIERSTDINPGWVGDVLRDLIQQVKFRDADALVGIFKAQCLEARTTALIYKHKRQYPNYDLYFHFYRWLMLGSGQHKCQRGAVYSLLNSAIRDIRFAKFCSIRRVLEFSNVEVRMCSCKQCSYSNPFLYYFVALCVPPCKARISVKEDFSGHFFWTKYGVTDISVALRKRTAVLADNIFARFWRWLKHMFYHAMPMWLSGIWGTVVLHLPRVLLGVGACIALTSLGRACGLSSSSTKQGNYFKMDTPKVATKPKVPLGSKLFSTSAASQAAMSQRSVIIKKIEKNSVLVFVTYLDNKTKVRLTRQARCLMLRGRSMLILRHYWEEFHALVSSYSESDNKLEGIKKDYSEIEFCLFFNKGKDAMERLVKVTISWEDLNKNVAWCSNTEGKMTSNYGIVILPNFVPQFCDIVKYIASEAEHKNCPAVGDLITVNGDSGLSLPLTVKRNIMVAESPTSSSVYMDRVYSYYRQAKGLCGSVLVVPHLGSGLGAIVGLHVAGSEKSGLGYAEPVYREMFDAFFETYKEPEPMPIPVDEDVSPDFDLDGNMMFYGCVPPKFAHKESGKSKIVPSMIAGDVYPVRTEVNPLKPNDPRQPVGSHPLRDGCAKHGTGNPTAFSGRLVEIVKADMTDKLQQKIPPVRAVISPLSMQQAVCGDVSVPHFESLNWKSSEGFPLSAHRPSSAHDKRWLFTLTEGQFGYKLEALDTKLKMQLQLRDKCFEKGVKPPTVYVDCLKDYRLTPEKCKEAGKTRIFSIAPIQCTIDVRMYMNDFCASLKNSRIKNSIGIGINADSIEWTELVNYLNEVGTKIVTLDYKNFGPSLMSQLVGASSDCIVEWFKRYGASDDHVRRVRWLLESDILNPVHLSGNIVYQTVNGIASGSPVTSELNSIPNLFYIKLAYLEIFEIYNSMVRGFRPWSPDYFPLRYVNDMPFGELPKSDIPFNDVHPILEPGDMKSFDDHVRVVVYGDDVIISVSDQVAPVFNGVSIKRVLANHGIHVTSAQKDAEMTPYTSLQEATFLKRSFRPHPSRPGIWLGPVDKNSVEECVNWVHTSDNPQDATLEVCRASLDLAYAHGPEYYNAHCEKLKRACNAFGKELQCKSWRDRDNEIFGGPDTSGAPTSVLRSTIPWTFGLSQQEL